MALLFLDSFDHYATADGPAKYATFTGAAITAAAGRRSSAALVFTSDSHYVITRPFSPASPTVILGLALKLNIVGAIFSYYTILSGGTAQLTAVWNSSGYLEVRRGGSGGTLLGTSSVALTANAFVFVELQAVIDPSAGSVTVKFDGVAVLTVPTANTAATGTGAWDAVRLNGGWNASPSVTVTIDDLYLLDGSGAAPWNTFLGDCRVDARYPTAEGASSAWTPLSGTDNALMVDETAPDGDTTYTVTPTVGATDTHVVQDAPVPGAVLYGVQVVICAKKDVAGTCAIAPVVRHGSTDYPGTAVNPGTTYAYAVTPYGLNPGTSAAWTEAQFNAAEFGYKRTA